MRTNELDYELPDELIARAPPSTRDGGRMLLIGRNNASRIEHRRVVELPDLLPSNALVVVNDTRVLRARLFATKATGGRAEIFLLRALDATGHTWTAIGRASKPIRGGTTLTVAPGFVVHIEGRGDGGDTMRVRLEVDEPWSAIDRHGHVPLPPYIGRADTDVDRERYQTVFAANAGAVAAPTAGLHFSEDMLARMRDRGIDVASVTLHVGLGTFAPVKVDDLDQHAMHAEWFRVPAETRESVQAAKASGRPVVAIGTTAVRALESWALGEGASEGETRLLIQPGWSFRVVDQLFTNFHLPRSTLLALVMAFAGTGIVRAAYRSAIEARYRFYSYGDAMWIA